MNENPYEPPQVPSEKQVTHRAPSPRVIALTFGLGSNFVGLALLGMNMTVLDGPEYTRARMSIYPVIIGCFVGHGVACCIALCLKPKS